MLPEAPESLRIAARIGGRLTCASALEHDGLWTPRARGTQRPLVHIALRPNAHHREAGVRAHWSSVIPVAERDLFDPVENVLACVASCFEEEQGFAVWESAVRRKHVTVAGVKRTKWGSLAARRLADEVGDRSDSGVESTFVYRCRRSGIPCLQQVEIDGHHVDVLIGRRLVVQIDGFEFHKDAPPAAGRHRT